MIRSYRSILAVVLGVGIFVGLSLALLQYLVPPSTQMINSEHVRQSRGNSFIVSVNTETSWPLLLQVKPDDNEHPSDSNLTISENGKALGPAHSLHRELERKGGGRYSHWGSRAESVVFFSTTDNSDPRTNGRKYEIVVRPTLLPFFAGLLAFLPILILFLVWLLFPKLDLIVGLSVTALIVWVSFFFGQITFAHDSSSYVAWSPLVPLGYPLFLSGIKTLLGGLRWAGVAQMMLLVFTCAFLAFSVTRLFASRLMGFAVLLVLLCYTQMFWEQGWLLSEALFVPLVLLHLGAAFFLIAETRISHALVLAATAALIIFVRPAGYFIPIGIVFFLIALRGRTVWLLKWVCVPFLIFTASTLVINQSVRGNGEPSQTGRVLFTFVAFLFNSDFIAGANKDDALVVEAALKPHLDGYEKSSGRTERFRYSAVDYNARVTVMESALERKCASDRNKIGVSHSSKACSFYGRESFFRDLFISTIYNRPLGYLRLIAEQLIEAWNEIVLLAYNSFRTTYLREVNDHQTRVDRIVLWKMPLANEEVHLTPELLDTVPGQFVEALEVGYYFIRAQRWLIYLIGIVTFVAMPIAMFFRRQSKHWLALGYCGVMIHGALLLTASVTVLISRYAVSVDPVVLVGLVIMVHGLLSGGRARMRQLEVRAFFSDLLRLRSLR